MARPGLRRLLADSETHAVDAAVVYRVDRLTRSLADFARILEALDKRGIAFVSVTQAFNTNSSMGRLALNVLLSVAQFKRDGTALGTGTAGLNHGQMRAKSLRSPRGRRIAESDVIV
jgi:site-specific DNA recombinase